MQKSFFKKYVQGLILTRSFHLNLSIFLFETCELKKHFFLLQHVLSTTTDVVVKLYYEEVPNEKFMSTSRLQASMDKAMD